MRRSSSRQRGSELPERSIAPPVDQKRFQCARVCAAVSSNVGTRVAGAAGANIMTAASAAERGAADSR